MAKQSRIMGLIVAAGAGTRARDASNAAARNTPKQYRPLGGVPVLRRALDALLAHSAVDAVQVVIGAGHEPAYHAAIAGLEGRLLPPVPGGADRQASVRLGLEAIAADGGAEIVLIHDAARPFLNPCVTEAVLAAVRAAESPVAALPLLAMADTVKRFEPETGEVTDTLPRETLGRAQTPQGFRFSAILAAHREAAKTGVPAFTDDTALAASTGMPVVAVEGAAENVKLTLPADFSAAERELAKAQRSDRMMETRTGLGFDVHAFATGRPLILGGITIPHTHGLAGHSDADVLLHAITDALFGAMADGDIGSHFPPSESVWKDASSDRFLTYAADRLRARGGRIVNIDATLICEAPKIGPHRDALRENIARLLGLAAARVALKATTSERLGFTGRREGMACQAIATVTLPAHEGEGNDEHN